LTAYFTKGSTDIEVNTQCSVVCMPQVFEYFQISNKRMWKHLYDKLGGNPGFTSAATCTRRHYEK